MGRKIPKKQVDAAIAALAKVRKKWLRQPGVSAVDVGYKIRDNSLTNELALRVHVPRKLPQEALAASEAFNVPGQSDSLDGFPVDVIEADYAAAVTPMAPESISRTGRVDPIVGGVSCGNPRISAGTVGAIVWDRTDGAPCILSNWHVLCGSLSAQAGESIYQPGVLDGGSPADRIAELRRWRLDRDADAALAKLLGDRVHSRDLLGLEPLRGIEEGELGMSVVKSGRTTGVTRGIIDGVAASVRIDYGEKIQQFHDQLHIVPHPPWPAEDYEVSTGGDSGSVWINEDTGKAIGLHFAGETERSPAAENAMANRITKVADLLEFSVTPLFLSPPPAPDQNLINILREVLCRHFPDRCQDAATGMESTGRQSEHGGVGPPNIEQLIAEVERIYRQH